jgi:prephenate dehydrogenase
MINHLTIIGLGHIGKSIATAIRSAAFAKNIIGYDPDIKNCNYLLQKNIIDSIQPNLVNAIKSSDLIVITVPLNQYSEIFEIIAHHGKESVAITEVANIKLPILHLAEEKLGNRFGNLIPCHPVIGFNYTKQEIPPMPDLFAERPVILTPTPKTKARCLHLVTLFWQKLGGEIEIKTAAENDAILATISHLPQIIAFTFINGLSDESSILRYITEHFKEFTRIVTESPVIWSDIFIANRQAILKELTRFELNLKKLREILESEDSDILFEQFNNAKQLRESV